MTTTTKRQLEVLTFIYDFFESKLYAPTLREMMAGLKIRSTNGVKDHLNALARKGLVTWEPGKARTLALTNEGDLLVEAQSTPRDSLESAKLTTGEFNEP